MMFVLIIGGIVAVGCLCAWIGWRDTEPTEAADFYAKAMRDLPARWKLWDEYHDAYMEKRKAIPVPRVTRKVMAVPGGGWSIGNWTPDRFAALRPFTNAFIDPPEASYLSEPAPGFVPMSHVFDTRQAAEAWLKATRRAAKPEAKA